MQHRPVQANPERDEYDPMKRWSVVIVLGCAQFVMVLDSTVMNVSISTVVKDLDTSVASMQAAITFYTLTMAAMMLVGAKLGDIWGRKRAFTIGAVIYATGSLITGLSPNVGTLILGWSVIEGLGAVLVIPAIAALIADNYEGRERVTAYAIIGAIAGAAVAAGPLIGGLVTTFSSWRLVFFGEVVVMIIVLAFTRVVTDATAARSRRIDVLSVVLSALGLVSIVFGMLQSKTWGWVLPVHPPVVGGVSVEPLGLSLVPYLILGGGALIWLFFLRQRRLVARGRDPLVDVSVFRIDRLRAGLSVLAAQYAIIAGLFFMLPVYLQMTLGFDAVATGIRIFPLSIGLVVFSFVGTRLTAYWSPRRIVRWGQLVLVGSSLCLLGSVSLDLRSVIFGIGMFFAGASLGLLASQLGNVTMSSVTAEHTSEVGGLQGVFQNLGSSLGTALIGSVLIASLSSSFLGAVNASDLPSTAKSTVAASTAAGVAIVPVSSVDGIANKAGLSKSDGEKLTKLYSDSQVDSLRTAFLALIVIAVIALAFSRNLPSELVGGSPRIRRKGIRGPTA
jgi:MFS family permease